MGPHRYNSPPLSPGRPKLPLDLELIRELSAKGYGFKRIAGEYRRIKGQYVCHMTIRDRLIRLATHEEPSSVAAKRPRGGGHAGGQQVSEEEKEVTP